MPYFPPFSQLNSSMVALDQFPINNINQNHLIYLLNQQNLIQNLYQNSNSINNKRKNSDSDLVDNIQIKKSNVSESLTSSLTTSPKSPNPSILNKLDLNNLPKSSAERLNLLAGNIGNLFELYPEMDKTLGIPPRSVEEQFCVVFKRSVSSTSKSSNSSYRCRFCQFEFVGGPQKIRVHLTGKRENGTRLSMCHKVHQDVKLLMESKMKKNKFANGQKINSYPENNLINSIVEKSQSKSITDVSDQSPMRNSSLKPLSKNTISKPMIDQETDLKNNLLKLLLAQNSNINTNLNTNLYSNLSNNLNMNLASNLNNNLPILNGLNINLTSGAFSSYSNPGLINGLTNPINNLNHVLNNDIASLLRINSLSGYNLNGSAYNTNFSLELNNLNSLNSNINSNNLLNSIVSINNNISSNNSSSSRNQNSNLNELINLLKTESFDTMSSKTTESSITSEKYTSRNEEETHCKIILRNKSPQSKSSNTQYQCLYCNFRFVGGPQKIRVHLSGETEKGTRIQSCNKVPESVRLRMLEKKNNKIKN